MISEKTLDSAHNFLYNNSVIIPGNYVPIRIGVKNIMTRSQLITKVANDTNMTAAEVEKVMDGIFGTIGDVLKMLA